MQDRMTPKSLGHPVRAIPACEGKRYASASQRFCDGFRTICSKLYVENGGIKAWSGSEQKPTLQIVSFTSNGMTWLPQHVRDHHANERFILPEVQMPCALPPGRHCTQLFQRKPCTFKMARTSMTAHHNYRIDRSERSGRLSAQGWRLRSWAFGRNDGAPLRRAS